MVSSYLSQLQSFHGPLYPPPPPPPPGVSASLPAPPYPTSYAQSYVLPPYQGYLPHGEVRTLFVSGLPQDVKPREIYNLFRDFPGYLSSQLKPSQAIAFVAFSDQQAAVSALQALNGLTFDLEKGSTLHIEFAKSNSRSKRASSGASNNEVFSASEYIKAKSGASSELPDACATLFVANLGPPCSEHELTQVFSRCPGFLKLKMQNKHGEPVAFVDFKDIACSMGALNHLQGAVLSSSGGQGMRLEFARTRMGQRKREKA